MIVIKEGFKILVSKSINALILYIFVPILVYGIIDYQKQNTLVCLGGAFISFILLNFYIIEKTIITDKSIKNVKSFFLLRREVLLSDIDLVQILKVPVESTSYNYQVQIKGKKPLSFGFVSIESLIKFVLALKSHNVNLEIASYILNKIKDKI